MGEASKHLIGALGRVLRGVSDKPRLYKYGKGPAEGASPEEIARYYGISHHGSPGDVQSFSDQAGNVSITPYSAEKWLTTVGEDFNDNAHAVYDAMLDTPHSVVTDIDALDARGGGSRFYRALYDANRSMGGLNAVGYLTPVNRIRRTENMLSEFMHHPDAGKNVLTDPQQALWLGDSGKILTPSDFQSLSPDEQLGVLANKSVFNTAKAAGPLRMIDPRNLSSRVLDTAMDSRESAARAVVSNSISGGRPAGEATLRRAMSLGGIRQALREGADEKRVIENIQNSDHPWWDLQFYCGGGMVSSPA